MLIVRLTPLPVPPPQGGRERKSRLLRYLSLLLANAAPISFPLLCLDAHAVARERHAGLPIRNAIDGDETIKTRAHQTIRRTRRVGDGCRAANETVPRQHRRCHAVARLRGDSRAVDKER